MSNVAIRHFRCSDEYQELTNELERDWQALEAQIKIVAPEENEVLYTKKDLLILKQQNLEEMMSKVDTVLIEHRKTNPYAEVASIINEIETPQVLQQESDF